MDNKDSTKTERGKEKTKGSKYKFISSNISNSSLRLFIAKVG
jgi:hypothetical protein